MVFFFIKPPRRLAQRDLLCRLAALSRPPVFRFERNFRIACASVFAKGSAADGKAAAVRAIVKPG